MISVYATQKQQKQIQQFLLQTQRSADRQVLIEATVVEVNLNKEHQAGVNWNAIASDVGLSSVSTLTASNLAQPPFVTLTGSTKANGFTQLDSTISMLQAYGTVRVLSSPKIMVLNNQSAILKVVDNKVYFTIKVDITPTLTTTSGGGTATTSLVTYETQVHTVPIGFIMNVTPYVSSAGDITLEVRPTITRIIGYVNDPNPALAQVKVTSKIPEVQVREMESMLRVASGQVAVLGGLMQNSVDNTTQGVPGLANTPYVSDAFSYKDNKTNKTELVIFMRPRVIHAASLNGDLKDFTRFLPGRNTQGPTTGEELQ
jgi:MSHA biogenesis protein MshL